MLSTPFKIESDAVYTDSDVRLGLGITDAALTRARREKRLRFKREGRTLLYRGQWLIDWLEGTQQEVANG